MSTPMRQIVETSVYAGLAHGRRLERAAILRLLAREAQRYKLNRNAALLLRELIVLVRARAKKVTHP